MISPGARYFTEGVFLAPNVDIIEVCHEIFTILPAQAAGSLAFWEPMKQRYDLPMMTMSIHSEYYISLVAIYGDQKLDKSRKSWVLGWFKEMESKGWPLGTYVGDAHPKERPHRYWTELTKTRIQQIGARRDTQSRICGIIPRNS